MNKKIVIKVGGNALDQLPASFYETLKQWQQEGHQMIIVHGGGPQIDTMLQKLQIETTKVDGLRVTTKEVLTVAHMVLSGEMNVSFVTSLQREGIQALGLNGCDGHLLTVEPFEQMKLGYVGEVIAVNHQLLTHLITYPLIPVIAPIGLSQHGEMFNINADRAACKIAAAFQATELMMVTDVPGIIDHDQIVKQVNQEKLAQLIDQQVIYGGMLPKVSAAVTALNEGVQQVRITNDIQSHGTLIIREKEGN